MLNVLVVTELDILALDITHCFYSNSFVTNNLQIRTLQDFAKIEPGATWHVALIDLPSRIMLEDIVEACKNNNPNCLIYGLFDSLDELGISEFLHSGGYSFALKSNLQSIANSLRTALAERENK